MLGRRLELILVSVSQTEFIALLYDKISKDIPLLIQIKDYTII